MKKVTCLIITIIVLLVNTLAFAQIEITASGNPYENEVEIALDVDITRLNLKQTGEQSWVFDQAFESTQLYNSRLPVDESLYGEYFPESDWCIKSLQYIPEIEHELLPGSVIQIADTLLDTYFYQSNGESFILENGMGFDHPFILDTVTAYHYPEPSNTYPQPLTIESEPWIEYRQVTVQQFFLWSATITDSSYIEVDGWGNLTVGSGTYPCIKLKRTERRNVYVADLVDEDIFTYTYLWLTDDYQPVLSVTGMDSANFDKALYVIRSAGEISSPVSCDPECGPTAAVSKDFVLSQNYPNPFNPTTTIAYTLPENADVKLSVYSLLGQEINILHNGFQQKGAHRILWNGLNAKGHKVPSGIYIYQLRVNHANLAKEMVLTNKMILSK